MPVAARLRHARIDIEDLVIALLESRPDSAAREVLEEVGLDVDSLLEGKAGWPVTGDYVEPMPPEMTMRPALREVQGRAHGIAIGSGSSEIDSRHILLAVLSPRADYLLLDKAGIDRRMVVSALERRGLKVARFLMQ